MKKVFIALLIIFSSTFLYSQSTIPKAQAMFLYNFCRLIEWPSHTRTGSFVIGVYGNSDIFYELETVIKGKHIGSQTALVRKFKSIDELSKCHVLFIPYKHTKEMETILSKVGSNSTLVLTEKPGAIEHGSAINYVIVGDKLKYEIAPENGKKKGLNISNKLVQMAYKVY